MVHLDKRLLTVNETAAALGFSPAKMWELLRQGHIRSLKCGGSRRIPTAAVDEYIAQLEREQGGALPSAQNVVGRDQAEFGDAH